MQPARAATATGTAATTETKHIHQMDISLYENGLAKKLIKLIRHGTMCSLFMIIDTVMMISMLEWVCKNII